MPVVTISWELGSDGDSIGRGLAERLGARYIDNAAIIATTQEYDATGARPSAPELAERAPNFFERLNEERRRYAVLLRAVIYRYAAEGNAILLGYGGGIMLREVRHVLKIKTFAPRDLRLQRVMAASGERDLSASKARAEDALRRTDRDRARHMRYLFNVDWADPTPYDLLLNTRTVSGVSAIDLLAGLAARPEFQPTGDSAAILHDLALSSQVEATLMHDPNIWVENLRVSARGGEVTISGQVLADEDRDAAEVSARQVAGVQIVHNEVAVQPPPLASM